MCVEEFFGRNSRIRKDYAESILRYVEDIANEAELFRDEYLNLSEMEKRTALKELLGYPLLEDSWRARCIQKQKLYEDEFYVATEYLFDVNGIKIGGILYEKPWDVGNESCAFTLALHGAEGSPELIGDLFLPSENYNHLIKRLLDDKLKIFAPQLLLWNQKTYPIKYDREKLNRRLVQLGGSITAVELKLLMSLLTYWGDYCNLDKMGVFGLSYGGMYALHLGAIDTRIKATFSSCWFSDRAKHCWHDWVYFNAQKKMFDAEIASLVLPRRLYLEVAKNDEEFPAKDGENERIRLVNWSKKMQYQAQLFISVFEGVHELNKDDHFINSFKEYILHG